MFRNRPAHGRALRVLGVVLFVLTAGCARPGADRPSILLVSLDTTRADRLGCYGYDRDTSPNLDALARESVVYTRAISTSSWTLPAHASMFTGKFVTSHGSRYDPMGPLVLTAAIDGPERWDRYRARGLDEGASTLAQVLRDHGYATAAVVGGPWLRADFGLDRGFDFYDDAIDTVTGRRAEDVTDGALRWIETHAERPFFLFLNYYDPHTPYLPPEEFADRYVTPSMGEVERTNARYDAEIRYMDHHFGRLLMRLRDSGLYDATLIVVTSDHGELLGEHGQFGHGRYLSQPEIHVPLFVKDAAGEDDTRRDDFPIQPTDLMPMILKRAGIPCPFEVQGAAAPEDRPPVVSEVYPLDFMKGARGHWLSLIEGRYKFAWNSEGNHALLDLDTDPGEQRNLILAMPQRAETMQRTLLDFLERLPPPEAPSGDEGQIDPETRDALRSLGYVE